MAGAAHPETQHVTITGGNIFVRSIGCGPEVVVLHGGPGASHLFLLPQFDSLAVDRTLLYYDQRGSGKSVISPSADLGWQSHVADLAQLVDRFLSRPATLIGHSWGALLALLYTLEYPGDTARLALIAPAPVTADYRESYRRRFAERLEAPEVVQQRAELERSGLRKSDAAAYRRRAFELSVMPYFQDPTNALHVEPFLVAARVRDAVWRSLGDYDLTARLRQLCVPTLVVHGRHDPIPIESSEHTAETLHARLEVFDDSGHLPFLEEPARFISTLDSFLPRERR
jgi:proline iminopeptidase